MIRNQGYRWQSGFSLVELIAVILILGALSVVVVPRFLNLNTDLQASRDDLVAALFYAQQIAMARDSSTNPVQLVTTSTTLSVTENAAALLNGGTQYPLSLPSGVTVTARTLNYDKLGRIPAATSFTLTRGADTLTVQVSGSGYAR